MTGQYKIQEMVHCVGTGWFFLHLNLNKHFLFFVLYFRILPACITLSNHDHTERKTDEKYMYDI